MQKKKHGSTARYLKKKDTVTFTHKHSRTHAHTLG